MPSVPIHLLEPRDHLEGDGHASPRSLRGPRPHRRAAARIRVQIPVEHQPRFSTSAESRSKAARSPRPARSPCDRPRRVLRQQLGVPGSHLPAVPARPTHRPAYWRMVSNSLIRSPHPGRRPRATCRPARSRAPTRRRVDPVVTGDRLGGIEGEATGETDRRSSTRARRRTAGRRTSRPRPQRLMASHRGAAPARQHTEPLVESSRILAGAIEWVRAAASSIARGMPSSRRQISTTVGVVVVSARTRAARPAPVHEQLDRVAGASVVRA